MVYGFGVDTSPRIFLVDVVAQRPAHLDTLSFRIGEQVASVTKLRDYIAPQGLPALCKLAGSHLINGRACRSAHAEPGAHHSTLRSSARTRLILPVPPT